MKTIERGRVWAGDAVKKGDGTGWVSVKCENKTGVASISQCRSRQHQKEIDSRSRGGNVAGCPKEK